ncbi:winged helix DNA-binding domain-containing protein [Cellulomonas massiliensis]|uniref:winged helix DNA-binding domain-containing protein n=1 Tax=Cellulomonas massiliensis TaxID=1465811 RepID=UPI0003169419|nr:winged helix DNA-binding domain-containing protein [Cellulomonas massiliensis]
MTSIDVAQRRARLARRHLLAGPPSPDVEAAAAAMVCLHATDPAGLFLSAWARVAGFKVGDLERAMYTDRTLVKQLAMRRTLFVFPRADLPVALAGASARVARTERARLAKTVEAEGMAADGEAWLARASAEVLAELDREGPLSAAALRARVPHVEAAVEHSQGKAYAGRFAVVGRVLTVLSAEGRVMRVANEGRWTSSRPLWGTTERVIGPQPALDEDAARAELVRRWLRTFGPGTEADVRWWLGSTLTAVRRSLADLGAVEVDLDGRTGWVLPDDTEPVEPVEPWAALLPALDPTVMGWSERDWYVGPYKAQVFDSVGNAGPTAWWDGRIVGGWDIAPSGEVEVLLLEDVGAEARAAIDARAEELTRWLAGTPVVPRFPSSLTATLRAARS